MPFEEYAEKSKDFIQSVSQKDVSQLLEIWIDKKTRKELREELGDQDIYPSAFRKYMELPDTDDVDILAKIGFDYTNVPTRQDRVGRFWDEENSWIENHFGLLMPNRESGNIVTGNDNISLAAEEMQDNFAGQDQWKLEFWRTALGHYSLFGIDDLEQARTYSAPQFVDEFGSFQSLTSRYGGAQKLKADLEEVKEHLYVPMGN